MYKSVKVLKAQCKRKQKKKKVKRKRRRRFRTTHFKIPNPKLYDNLDNFIKIDINKLYNKLVHLVNKDNFPRENCKKLHDIIVAIEKINIDLVPEIAYTTWNENCSYYML